MPNGGPANGGSFGIPITLYNAANVTDVTFSLSYNPALLNITAALQGASSDATDAAATLTLVSNSGGVATFHYHDNTPISATPAAPLVLGDLSAVVPNAAKTQYQVKEQLQFGSIVINGNAGTGAVSANGLHVNAYFGDVNADHNIDGLDKLAIDNVAQGRVSGFNQFSLMDPVIVGDVAGDLQIDAGDVSVLDAYIVLLAPTQIPVPPAGLTGFASPNAADPNLSLSAPRSVTGTHQTSTAPVVSVMVDHPDPAGSTGLTQATLALTYDPSALSVTSADIALGSVPSQGRGWQIMSVVDSVKGQIAIQLYSDTPITSAQAGSLVNIAFHVVPGASMPATAVQLVDSVMPNGMAFSTVLADAQSAMILGQGVDQLLLRTGAEAQLPASSVNVITATATLHLTSAEHSYAEAPVSLPGKLADAVGQVNEETVSATSNNGATNEATATRNSATTLIVSGAPALVANMAQAIMPAMAAQVVQIVNLPLVNSLLNMPRQMVDQLFLATARRNDAVIDADALNKSQFSLVWENLQQDWLFNQAPSAQSVGSNDDDADSQSQDAGTDTTVVDQLFALIAEDMDGFGG